MAYFQRYYLRKTLFQTDLDKIEQVRNACLFLSTKANEVTLPEMLFCQTLQLDPSKARLAHYEHMVVKELDFQFFVHTPIQSVNSLIFKIEDVAMQLDQNLTRQQAQKLSSQIRNGAEIFCFFSYRSRELTFCVSPALIAMAALNMQLKKDN